MPAALDLRLGVDVGGTNTDAVVLDRDGRLLAKAKTPTSADVTGGVTRAIDAVLAGPRVARERITHFMLGTTHATNAVIERRRLGRVVLVRIASPATHAAPPLYGWPDDLRASVSAGETIVGGGIEYDGREIARFDADEVARFLDSVVRGAVGLAGANGLDGVAIASVFAPVSARHEEAAAEVVRRTLGDVHVSRSSDIGSLGLLERENATVLNAALVGVVREVATAVRSALAAHELHPASFFAQNDGTLMALDYALEHPVLTIGSGPANSMRGAASLSGSQDAIVVDVGGTSTDVGVLAKGFPRESSAGVEIGGVRTNFRMPDLVTIALGGGTVIVGNQVGPNSVGFRLEEEALVFGGQTPTLTDAAVCGGRTTLGDPALAAPHRDRLTAALAIADERAAAAVDRIKTAKGDLPLVAVGGGSVLLPDALPGVSEIRRPEHFEVANAIGAAIASVSGEVDRIAHYDRSGRERALAEIRDEALGEAVLAGADPGRVELVEIEEIPLAYLTTPAVRVRAKAAGPLA